QWNFNTSAGINFDWQGRSQNTNLDSNIQFSFQRNTYFGFGATVGSERLFEEEFGVARTTTQAGSFFGASERSTRQFNPYVFAGTRFSKKYHASVFLNYSQNAFDFDFGASPKYPRVSPAALIDPNAPLDPGPGKFWDINISFEYQPVNALNTSIDYTFNKLTRDDTQLVA